MLVRNTKISYFCYNTKPNLNFNEILSIYVYCRQFWIHLIFPEFVLKWYRGRSYSAILMSNLKALCESCPLLSQKVYVMRGKRHRPTHCPNKRRTTDARLRCSSGKFISGLVIIMRVSFKNFLKQMKLSLCFYYNCFFIV